MKQYIMKIILIVVYILVLIITYLHLISGIGWFTAAMNLIATVSLSIVISKELKW